jgi:hypothetical protein
MNGTVWAIVVAVHHRPRRRRELSSTRRRQWTASRSGSPSQDHGRRVDRQLAYLLGAPVGQRRDPEIAAVELGPERDRRVLERGPVILAPLRQRRVTGLVKSNQPRHATSSLEIEDTSYARREREPTPAAQRLL